VRFTDAYYTDADNSPRGKVDPYAVANLRAGYSFGMGRVFAYVKNVFDTEIPIDYKVSANTATMLQPRSYGLGLEFWF
jgi:outer membrane receptor protein involved in Fe transport